MFFQYLLKGCTRAFQKFQDFLVLFARAVTILIRNNLSKLQPFCFRKYIMYNPDRNPCKISKLLNNFVISFCETVSLVLFLLKIYQLLILILLTLQQDHPSKPYCQAVVTHKSVLLHKSLQSNLSEEFYNDKKLNFISLI